MLDLTDTIIPKSDQLNADDLISGPRTFTIERVNRGSAEQPLNVYLAEVPGRPYRPSKSMRRVLVAAWGKDGETYTGRKLTLYRDPSVRFVSDEVGGIKISHLSQIERQMAISLTVKRGQKAPHKVAPLAANAPTSPREPSADDVSVCDDIEQLRDMYRATSSELIKTQITERVAELSAPALPEGDLA